MVPTTLEQLQNLSSKEVQAVLGKVLGESLGESAGAWCSEITFTGPELALFEPHYVEYKILPFHKLPMGALMIFLNFMKSLQRVSGNE